MVFLSDVADSASTNRKCMHVMGKALPDNVLYWPQRCIIHQVFRCIDAASALHLVESIKSAGCLPLCVCFPGFTQSSKHKLEPALI